MNKKGVYLISLFIYLLSAYVAYAYISPSLGSFLKEKKDTVLSPILRYEPPKSNGHGIKSDNQPKTEPCPLNGKLYSKSQREVWEKRRPLGIMIENHVKARPQSGLSSADVVYEAVAEGGITRFLSIFYCQDAAYVGPVRSARIYFIKILQGYGNNPLYAHVGGANTQGPANALGEIRILGWASLYDLNQFSVPFPYYWRDYERLPNRVTEHTVYTSTSKLWKYAKKYRKLTNVDQSGNSWDETFSPWEFVDGAKEINRGEVSAINFSFWSRYDSDNYSVSWSYDRKTNSYKRKNGGKPHLDRNNGKQLESKNIVILFTKESPANDGYPGGHLLYKVVGKGKALVFQNGQVIKGRWQKPDEERQVKIYDENGDEVPFVRGKIFIEILPVGNKVEY